MEIRITAIKFETVNGKKTGKSFSFNADPKKPAIFKTEARFLTSAVEMALTAPSGRKSRSMWLRVASSRKKNWMM